MIADNPTAKPACRPGCAACCIAPSISSPLPGLPHGKPAGMPCPHLDANLRCRLFGQPERPAVCGSLPPSHEMCGKDRQQALDFLQRLEHETAPQASTVPRETSRRDASGKRDLRI